MKYILLFLCLNCYAVTLQWDASPSVVDGYYLYQVIGSQTNKIDVGNVTRYTLQSESCKFAVTAYDSNGESDFSNWIDWNGQPTIKFNRVKIKLKI